MVVSWLNIMAEHHGQTSWSSIMTEYSGYCYLCILVVVLTGIPSSRGVEKDHLSVRQYWIVNHLIVAQWSSCLMGWLVLAPRLMVALSHPQGACSCLLYCAHQCAIAQTLWVLNSIKMPKTYFAGIKCGVGSQIDFAAKYICRF